MVDFQQLADTEWLRLKAIRLTALAESPDFFLSTFTNERQYDDKKWQSEFDRGEWTIGSIDGKDVCLLGVTKSGPDPDNRCLEYMWVDPRYRNHRLAFELVFGAIERLYQAGFERVHLWVLDGNVPATNLYKSLHFEYSNVKQWLEDRPTRYEERMQLKLTKEILDEARQRSLTALAPS